MCSRDLKTDFTLKVYLELLSWQSILILIDVPILDIALDLIYIDFKILIFVKIITFSVDSNSSIHVDNKKKYILVLDGGPIQGLDDTTATA